MDCFMLLLKQLRLEAVWDFMVLLKKVGLEAVWYGCFMLLREKLRLEAQWKKFGLETRWNASCCFWKKLRLEAGMLPAASEKNLDSRLAADLNGENPNFPHHFLPTHDEPL